MSNTTSGSNKGKLFFKGADFEEQMNVYWELKSGELIEGQTWEAFVWFSKDYFVPERAEELVFKALADDSMEIKLTVQGQDDTALSCVIADILELNESGYVDISSPDLGRARIFFKKPTNQPPKEKGRRSFWPFKRRA